MSVVTQLGGIRTVYVSALMLALLVGCTPPQHFEHPGESTGRPDEPAGHGHAAGVDSELRAKAQKVRVLPNTDLGCVTEALGLVDVHEGVSTSEQALDELRLEAARLGADAVLGVEFEHADGKAATHLSGMAVRCRDLLRGRAYDVIGIVEVPGAMGDEEGAFRALRERARAVHADLLIGVTFVHGEGSGPTRLRATAIRIRETPR